MIQTDAQINLKIANRSNRYYDQEEDTCIYFSTRSYQWVIPLYYFRHGYCSATGGKFNHISANVDEINDCGYISGDSFNHTGNYAVRLNTYSVSNNRTINKVALGTDGKYMNMSAGVNDIEADDYVIMQGDGNTVKGYNLYDAESAYELIQYNPEKLDLSIEYKDCMLTGSSMAGRSVLFDKEGYVEIQGEASDYSISMTYNANYPTDWFSINVMGQGAELSSLKMVEQGYILTSDNLQNVRIKAFDRDDTASISFSTYYDSVFIYEIDENTIGLKVDTDVNGTYETELPIDTFQIGDTNLDGNITISDVTAIQYHLAELELFTDEQLALADTNGDGEVNISDATHLQMFLADFDGVVLGKS